MPQAEFYPALCSLVNSYTRHKILQRRFNSIIQRSGFGEAICPPEFAALAIKFVGDEVTAELSQKFKAPLSTAAADRIIADHAELFSDEGYEKSFRVSLERLPSLVNEMGDVIFKEKQNVGTVGAFLAFGATFAAYCEQKESLGFPAVEPVVKSVSKHLDDNLQSWIKTNGGLGMVQSATVECHNHVTAARQRKVQFVDSLKLIAEHSLQTSNPLFYVETCKLVLELQDLLGLEEKKSETFFDYGMFLFGQGNYSGARDALKKALKNNSSQPHFVGLCHFQMGVINCHMENFQAARLSFQEALECKEIMLGQENLSAAICHHWIGYVYRREKNIDKALEIQHKVLQEMEKNTANITSGSLISDSCFELGCIYQEMGNHQRAVDFHQRSLLIREKDVADFKPKLQSYTHLALVLMTQKLERPHASSKHSELTSRIVNLLGRAVALVEEQAQHGNLRDRFPVIIFANTERLESTKDLMLLALELCKKLNSVLQEENKEVKCRIEELEAELKNLLRTVLDEREVLKQTSYSDSRYLYEDLSDLQLANSKENEQVVPPEINLRGRLALEAYNKALNEGKTCIKRVPVMLIGQDRSGKTSLKKSLTGKPFNPDEDSTVGIDVDPSYFKVTTEVWKGGEKDQVTTAEAAISYEHYAARLVVENLKQEKCPPEERVVEDMQSERFSQVRTVSSRSEFSEVSSSSEEHSASNHHFAESSADITEVAQDSEVSKGAREYFQTSVFSGSDDSNRVSDVLADHRSDSTQGEGKDTPFAPPKIPDEIETLIKKLLLEVGKVKEDEDVYSVIWDFGGQSVYYVTHPLFLTARAMYLLVYDLSRDPHEIAKPVVKQGMFKKIEDSFGTATNLDYLDFWMNSLASLASQDEDHPQHASPKFTCKMLPEKLPPVFLVCTHADEPFDGADPCVLAREVYGSLQTKPYKTQLYEDVFVVDNTKSGSESESSEIARLRQEVLAAAKELPQMKEVIPIKWLKYEKALQVAKGEGHKWMHLEGAKQIASEVCKINDDQEFLTLLNFLHDQRIVIHFDDTPVLNNLVVLDPQWLIDVFKKVITIKPYDHKEREFKELWLNLETTGILIETLLEHVWGPILHQQETFQSLVAIMEKFSLLCPWPSSDASNCKQYLVPSMLMSHPPQDIIHLVASAQIPSLFLKFESGQVPVGLFPRLILQFFQWGKDEFWSSMNPQLYHNFARFYISGAEECSVLLLCHSSSIEVVVHRGNLSPGLTEGLQSKLNICSDARQDAFEVACAGAVQRQLGLMLESMRKEFCWLKNMTYRMGIICPVCCQGGVVKYCRTHHKQSCTREECLHFWSESELRSAKQFIICTRSATALSNKFEVKQFKPWFASPGEELAIDERDGRLLYSGEGNGDKSLDLPSKFVEALMSQSCDPKEVVLQLKQSLQFDQSSLEQPEPGTKRLIRCLATKAKRSNRLDVVKHLREITPAGTTGPLLPDHLDIRNIPIRQMRELTIDLSSGDEWMEVAEKLGLTPKEIRYLDKRILNPCDAALAFIAQRCHISVGDLYDVLNECGLPVIADLL